jgi:hypothetical protein
MTEPNEKNKNSELTDKETVFSAAAKSIKSKVNRFVNSVKSTTEKQRLNHSRTLARTLGYIGSAAYTLATLTDEASEAVEAIGSENIQLLTDHKEKFEILGVLGIGGALVSSICIGLYGMKCAIWDRKKISTLEKDGFHFRDRMAQAAMQVTLISCKLSDLAYTTLVPLALTKCCIDLFLCAHMAYKENKNPEIKTKQVIKNMIDRATPSIIGIVLATTMLVTAAAPPVGLVIGCAAAYAAVKLPSIIKAAKAVTKAVVKKGKNAVKWLSKSRESEKPKKEEQSESTTTTKVKFKPP